MTEETAQWVRLFMRLEASIAHHRRDKALFTDEVDEALYAAHKRILTDAAALKR